MSTEQIATALRRAESVFERRPAVAQVEDGEAVALWRGGLKVATTAANGMRVMTDLPEELGGTGEYATPGWLFRAALAACAATRIAMEAALANLQLDRLEVIARSRSDVRGILRMLEADGSPVRATPFDVRLEVRIAAMGVTHERLRTLVEMSQRSSPVSCAANDALNIELDIQIG